MGKTFKEEYFEKGEDQMEVFSHYRVSYNKYGQEIKVPVIDVRDGIAQRLIGYGMCKRQNRSKWINYNEYHVSRKPKTNI